MPGLAHGRRDASGVWHADDPGRYPPLDVHGTLPWSVLRQDSGPWQARKNWWLALGVHQDAPRAHAPAMIATGRHGRVSGGLSRFDPHLAELLLAWYCPPGGTVLDPFAGGPVRGLVAGHLGRPYLGVDLLAGQVAANRSLAGAWRGQGLLSAQPRWQEGDADAVLADMDPGFDYVLCCPPYHNRERYSRDPRDLSAMRWPVFALALARILAMSARLLARDRFATIVVSDVRDHAGHLRGLPGVVDAAMRDAGLRQVNEQVLVEPGGLRAKTMRAPWEACRTVTRTHQMVLTYVRGDRRAATAAVRGAGC